MRNFGEELYIRAPGISFALGGGQHSGNLWRHRPNSWCSASLRCGASCQYCNTVDSSTVGEHLPTWGMSISQIDMGIETFNGNLCNATLSNMGKANMTKDAHMKQDPVLLGLLIVCFMVNVAVLQFGQVIGEGKVIDVVVAGIMQALR